MARETSMDAPTDPEPSLAEQGRAALARHAWGEALEKLTEADAQGGMSPGDLDAYADASWWNGRLEQAIELRERAYAAATRAGQPEAATMVAIKLAADNIYRSSDAHVRRLAAEGGTPARRRRGEPRPRVAGGRRRPSGR